MNSNTDAFLRQAGHDAILRRKIAGVDTDATVRVARRNFGGQTPLASGTVQDAIGFVMTLTQIDASGWPGTADQGTGTFVRPAKLPRRGDELIWNGQRFRIEAADPIEINGEIVRINVSAKGGA